MKRLLPCVILALAFHGIILSTDFSWLRLAPGVTPAAKPLSITLATDMSQKRKAQAVAPQKQPEKQPEPRENLAAMQTLEQAEQPNQFQNLPTAMPPKPIIKEIRRKKSLKALTFKKQEIKTIEATQVASSPKLQPVRQPLPEDTGFIKKTRHVPDGSSESTKTATILPDTQSDNTLSVPVLKLARPLYKQNTPPPYPRKARRLGYEGIVMLKVLIDENGRVDDLTVLKSSGHTVLDRAALSAVGKWLFEPGTEGGIKKKMWVKIPVRFDLK